MSIDQVALLPAYAAAGTALLAFLTDLVVPGRRGPVTTVTALGSIATGGFVVWLGLKPDRSTFCGPAGCSYVWDSTATIAGLVFAAATFAVLLLSAPAFQARDVPSGEYCFLLACSMTGGVVLGAARDLITIIVALETLTLPLYVLVGLRRRVLASAEAAVTFFIVSVVSTAITLLGAALLYGLTGAIHLKALADALAAKPELRDVPLTAAAVVLVLAGLAFKVAAVPFHAWAPSTYDGAPLPIAAYLSTASKLGGVLALLFVSVQGLRPWLDVAGPVLAAIAAVTMTVGNLVALRQRRMVRLLAWSSIAQAGYLLAPLGIFTLASGRTNEAIEVAVAAVLAYTVFYIAMELGAFGALVALRGAEDGGELSDYAGSARRHPWATAAFAVAIAGLAGLPPGLAGLFAKVAVVRALLDGGLIWLAALLAVNAVIGLAYYVRAAAALFAAEPLSGQVLSGEETIDLSVVPVPPRSRVVWPVAVAVSLITLVGLVIGFAPQLVLDAL